ncbi:GPCR fungal pheromone mating factor, partial [Mycena latifolia]
WRVKNLATFSLMTWLSWANLAYGIDTIIWDGNINITATIWCDITTKIAIGRDVALPCCCLCIARQFNHVAAGVEIRARGWWARVPEFSLCWLFPMLIMALHYIVQGHRFDIVEDFGCFAAIYVSWPAIFILDVPALVPAALALVYSSIAWLRIYRRQRALRLIERSQPPLTPLDCIKLMVLTVVISFWPLLRESIPLGSEIQDGLLPWESWSFVHAGFSFIGQYTLSVFSPEWVEKERLLSGQTPISTVFFCVLFVGREAITSGGTWVRWVRNKIRRTALPDVCAETTEHHVLGPHELSLVLLGHSPVTYEV